jgi:hypothetical protein
MPAEAVERDKAFDALLEVLAEELVDRFLDEAESPLDAREE